MKPSGKNFKIIGLTGPNASGKGEAAKYLINRGYRYHSLSDVVREEARKLRLEITRENLVYVGNLLRKKHGPGILARKIKARLKGKSVIDSIRNPYEIRELRKLKSFTLLGINAPGKLRFRRLKERNRAGDMKTLDEFIKYEKRENSMCSTGQQLSKCYAKADKVIINDGTIAELRKKIRESLNENK